MLRRTSVVITTIGASPLTALSPVSRPTFVRAVHPHEVPVLLVRERLERRRVERLRPAGEREADRVLGDDRLARAGRRGDEHRLPGVERVERLALERIEGEAEPGLEGRARRRRGHGCVVVVGACGGAVVVVAAGAVGRPGAAAWPGRVGPGRAGRAPSSCRDGAGVGVGGVDGSPGLIRKITAR